VQEALIVDDSKTARAILRNKLVKKNISVAMVESGEEALVYLRENHPDVIFMDHMMPGMDGFDAVKAIKANPKSSSIPIVMHTTKQGDIYIGQAKALGAADILPKQGTDQDLVKVLDRLRAMEADSVTTQPQVEIVSLVKNDNQILQDDIDDAEFSDTGSLTNAETYKPERPSNGLAMVTSPHNDGGDDDETSDPRVSFLGTYRQWIVATIWLFPTLWLLWLYLPAQEQLQEDIIEKRGLYNTIQWALNQQTSYDYGEIPNSGRRLDILQELMPQLAAANFQGILQMEGHVGEFCLSQVLLDDGSEINMLPEFELPVVECTSIGSSIGQALQLSIKESPEFSRFLDSAKSRYPNIEIEVVPLGASQPEFPYPADLEGVTAGDWNEVALANNRVHFTLIPSSSSF